MKRILFVTVALLLAASARAQPEASPARQVGATALQSSPQSGFISSFSFTRLKAERDGTTAEANIGLALGSWNLNLGLSSPVGSRSKRATPLTVAGLSEDASFSLGVQRLFMPSDRSFTPDLKAYNAFVRQWKQQHPGRDFDTDSLSARELRRFRREVPIRWGGTPWYLTGRLRLLQQNFRYAADTFYTPADASRLGLSLSGTVGIVASSGIWALSAGYLRHYDAPGAETFLVPAGSGGVLQQLELSPSGPVGRNDLQLRLDYLTNEAFSRSFMLNPHLQLLLPLQRLRLELPVYFLTSGELGFIGGIYGAYSSGNDFDFALEAQNFGLGVFIGASVQDILQL